MSAALARFYNNDIFWCQVNGAFGTLQNPGWIVLFACVSLPSVLVVWLRVYRVQDANKAMRFASYYSSMAIVVPAAW